jgi:hypothetical protein
MHLAGLEVCAYVCDEIAGAGAKRQPFSFDHAA